MHNGYVTIQEAAQDCHRSVRTLYRWLREHNVSVRRTRGGKVYLTVNDVKRIAEAEGLPWADQIDASPICPQS